MPVRFKMCRVRADSSGTLCRQKARTAKRPEDGMIRCFKAHPIIHFPKGLAGEGGQMLLPVEAAVPVTDSRIHISTRQFSWSRPSLACFELRAQKSRKESSPVPSRSPSWLSNHLRNSYWRRSAASCHWLCEVFYTIDSQMSTIDANDIVLFGQVVRRLAHSIRYRPERGNKGDESAERR